MILLSGRLRTMTVDCQLMLVPGGGGGDGRETQLSNREDGGHCGQ